MLVYDIISGNLGGLMNNLMVRKYVIDIVFIIVGVSLLTWFWFGPYKDKIRIKESLRAYNVEFNDNISYNGFDSFSLDNNKITKELSVTNNGTNNINYVISFDNLTNNKNNYINYVLTDNEGNRVERNLSLEGYILENNIGPLETKNYEITLWYDDINVIDGNLEIILKPNVA